MAERILTAMYDSRGAAEAARDQLEAIGIARDSISIRGTDRRHDRHHAPPATRIGALGQHHGRLFPEDDRYTYEEGVRRGSYLLSARVPEGLEDRANDILDGTDAVNVDERAESWRQGGWAGYQAGSTGSTTSASARHRRAAGMRSTARAGGASGTAGYASARVPTGTAATGLGAAGTSTSRELREGEEVDPGRRGAGPGRQARGRPRQRARPQLRRRAPGRGAGQPARGAGERRAPAGRPRAAARHLAVPERTIEATERGEEAVVSKQARVVEEVGIRKDVDTRTETVRDSVRKTEVEVEDDRTGTGRGGLATERDERVLATDNPLKR